MALLHVDGPKRVLTHSSRISSGEQTELSRRACLLQQGAAVREEKIKADSWA